MITKHRFDESKLKRVEVRGGEYVDWLQMAIHEPSCSVDLPRFGGELVAHARPAISNWTGLW